MEKFKSAGLTDVTLSAGSNNYSRHAAERREWFENHFLAAGAVP